MTHEIVVSASYGWTPQDGLTVLENAVKAMVDICGTPPSISKSSPASKSTWPWSFVIQIIIIIDYQSLSIVINGYQSFSGIINHY